METAHQLRCVRDWKWLWNLHSLQEEASSNVPGCGVSSAKAAVATGARNFLSKNTEKQWAYELETASFVLGTGPKMGLQYLGYCRTIWCPLCTAKSLVPVLEFQDTPWLLQQTCPGVWRQNISIGLSVAATQLKSLCCQTYQTHIYWRLSKKEAFELGEEMKHAPVHQSSKSQSQCHSAIAKRQASLLSPHAGMWPSTASNEWVSSAIRSMYIFTWKKKKRSRFVKSFDWKIECKMIQTYNADSIVKLKFMSRYYVKCITAIHDAQCVFFA